MATETAPSEVGPILEKSVWEQKVEDGALYALQTLTPVSVVGMDLNRFKIINDLLGHLAGDNFIAESMDVLALAMSKLRTRVDERQPREPDIVTIGNVFAGRTGGDEMAVFADTDEHGAKLIYSRLDSAFGELFDQPDKAAYKKLGVGVAIGRATFTPDQRTREEISGLLARDEIRKMFGVDVEDPKVAAAKLVAKQLIDAADQAMYADKARQFFANMTPGRLEGIHRIVIIAIQEGIDPFEIPSYLTYSGALNNANSTPRFLVPDYIKADLQVETWPLRTDNFDVRG